MPTELTKTHLQSVLTRIDIDSHPGGCWVWRGYVNSNGYGEISLSGNRTLSAHRAIYDIWRGPIPAGRQLDHLCRNRECVNPDHLEPVTQKTNILRGEGPTAVNARKTHCKNGHEYTAENTIHRHGSRLCRACNALSETRRRVDLDDRTPEIVERRQLGESFRSIGRDMGADHRTIAKRYRHYVDGLVSPD